MMSHGFWLVTESATKDARDARFTFSGVEHAAADAYHARWFGDCARSDNEKLWQPMLMMLAGAWQVVGGLGADNEREREREREREGERQRERERERQRRALRHTWSVLQLMLMMLAGACDAGWFAV